MGNRNILDPNQDYNTNADILASKRLNKENRYVNKRSKPALRAASVRNDDADEF